MKSFFSPYTIFAAAVGCFFIIANAKADLLLTGNLVGIFHPSSAAHSVVTNAADGDAAFRIGTPVEGSFRSGVGFNAQTFSDLGSGDTFAFGMLSYYNGITKIGTSSGEDMLDLYLELAKPQMGWVHLATMTFRINATINAFSNPVPDSYSTSFTQPPLIWVGNEWLRFNLNGIPAMTSIEENTRSNIGSITLTEGNLVPVPEQGTSDLFLGLGLVALVGYAGLYHRDGLATPRSLSA